MEPQHVTAGGLQPPPFLIGGRASGLCGPLYQAVQCALGSHISRKAMEPGQPVKGVKTRLQERQPKGLKQLNQEQKKLSFNRAGKSQ